MNVLEHLGQNGVIPVITIDRAEDAVPLAQALYAGGMNCIEITFRTPVAAAAIHRIAEEVPQILVGAGTVLNEKQAEQAIEAHAKFIISPGFNPSVVKLCLAQKIAVLPGVLTPSEITMGIVAGLKTLKLFPAEASGGVQLLTDLQGPFPDVTFMPSGGITANNLTSYLALTNVVACGATWLAPREMLIEGHFTEITRLASETSVLVHQAREGHN